LHVLKERNFKMQQELRRDLGLPQAILTVIGIVIGSGIFALPAVVFAHAAAPGLGLFAWVLGGLITLAAGLTVSELTAAMPKAGGTYVFLREAYGEWLGFLQGWAFFLTYNSAMNAALAMIFTTYLTALVPLSSVVQKVAGLVIILLLTIVNALGVKFGGLIQVVATVGKLLPIGLLIIFGFGHMDIANLYPMLPAGKETGAALAGAVLPVLWAYDGWIQVGMLAEEVRNPQRNLPLAFVGGLSVVALIYIAFNVVLVGVIPMDRLIASEKPVIPLAQALFGSGGAKLVTVGMLVSMFGTLNALVMTAPRYYFAMARDGLFPAARRVSQLHPKFQTPVTALAVSALWSSVLLLSGQFGQLLNLVVFVAWVFNILSMGAVLILRRTRPDMPRPYRAWGYPVVPLIGIGAGFWIVVSLYQSDPKMALLGLGLTLTGVPVYWLLRRRGSQAA
jgi:APA family basic amino acid/polyamine antiporter